MHGINNAKVAKTQQARIAHHCKNIEEKLLQTNIARCFNKKCRFKYFTPKYIHITVNGKNACYFKQNMSNSALLIPQHM
jgi:hypothetical protein